MRSFSLWLYGEEESKIDDLLDSGEYILFFIYNNKTFGTTEDSRIAYSLMVHPDELDDIQYFVADCLSDLVKGNKTKPKIFSKKDIKNIKIISREETCRKLSNIL